MKIVIVTGLSGSGKTHAIKVFEDLGFFCVDNMIPDLIPHFIDFCKQMKTNIKKVALGIDIRGGNAFNNLISIIEKTTDKNIKYEIVFMDCNDDVLIKRYKENRRNHPLAINGRIIDGIKKERKLLEKIKNKAKYYVDTSNISAKKLKETINKIYNKKGNSSLIINVLSFGFKYGIPTDADYVFDARFLPNPFYIDDLREKNGNDQEVFNYVMKFEKSKIFCEDLENMMLNVLPDFVKEGRNQLVIAIGCTGGQHRSVTIARVIAEKLKEKNFDVILTHREIDSN